MLILLKLFNHILNHFYRLRASNIFIISKSHLRIKSLGTNEIDDETTVWIVTSSLNRHTIRKLIASVQHFKHSVKSILIQTCF